MNILQKHTAQFFGTVQHDIKRSGKVIYTARGITNSDLGLYANWQQVQRTVNYSAQYKSNMKLLDRILYR
jgi:hypothetical protein